MAIDPTQLKSQMSLDKSGDFTCPTPKLIATNNNLDIDISSNLKSSSNKPNTSNSNDLIEFIDSPFATSLIPYINLLGITDNFVCKLSPLSSTKSWINIASNELDIQDAAYLLLDNNTKLLRSGGLLHDKYISNVEICDLTLTLNSECKMNENITKMNWLTLPQLHYKRHGHSTLCINIFNTPHIIAIGGFDSKGNTIKKCESISVDEIKCHIENKKTSSWNIKCMQLSQGVSDFGMCADVINNRIYICGGLNSQFKSLSHCQMYDMNSGKWLNLPQLNYARHYNKTQLLCGSNLNPNILMTFGGWTGVSRNSIEVIDVRNNTNKWQINIGHKNNKKKRNKQGFGVFNYPHSCSASIVKKFGRKNKHKKNKNIQQQLNGLNINDGYSCKDVGGVNENVVIVCGHREGLFIETNVIEALEMRTKKWFTVARFKYAQNCNVGENIRNVQQNNNEQKRNDNEIENFKKYHRFSNAFRYLTLL